MGICRKFLNYFFLQIFGNFRYIIDEKCLLGNFQKFLEISAVISLRLNKYLIASEYIFAGIIFKISKRILTLLSFNVATLNV